MISYIIIILNHLNRLFLRNSGISDQVLLVPSCKISLKILYEIKLWILQLQKQKEDVNYSQGRKAELRIPYLGWNFNNLKRKVWQKHEASDKTLR